MDTAVQLPLNLQLETVPVGLTEIPDDVDIQILGIEPEEAGSETSASDVVTSCTARRCVRVEEVGERCGLASCQQVVLRARHLGEQHLKTSQALTDGWTSVSCIVLLC